MDLTASPAKARSLVIVIVVLWCMEGWRIGGPELACSLLGPVAAGRRGRLLVSAMLGIEDRMKMRSQSQEFQ